MGNIECAARFGNLPFELDDLVAFHARIVHTFDPWSKGFSGKYGRPPRGSGLEIPMSEGVDHGPYITQRIEDGTGAAVLDVVGHLGPGFGRRA